MSYLLFSMLALAFSIAGIVKENILLCLAGQVLGVLVLFSIFVNFFLH